MVVLTLPDRSTIEEPVRGRRLETLLVDLGLNPCEVIVTRDARLLPDDALLAEDDRLRIVTIIHGG
jgi:sulfur carrier protein ThiS